MRFRRHEGHKVFLGAHCEHDRIVCVFFLPELGPPPPARARGGAGPRTARRAARPRSRPQLAGPPHQPGRRAPDAAWIDHSGSPTTALRRPAWPRGSRPAARQGHRRPRPPGLPAPAASKSRIGSPTPRACWPHLCGSVRLPPPPLQPQPHGLGCATYSSLISSASSLKNSLAEKKKR